MLPYLLSTLNTFPKTSLMGEVNIPAPNKHFKRSPHEWIFYVILDGTMKIQEENCQYLLSAGDILFLSPGKCHFGLPVNDSIHYYYIHFYWDELLEILLTPTEYQKKKLEIQEHVLANLDQQAESDFLLLPKHLHPSQRLFENIISDMQYLLKNQEKPVPHQHIMHHCLFFMLLLKLSRFEIDQYLPEAQNSFLPALSIMGYLKEHYKEKITSLVLENEFHHNFDYMNRKFKAATGTTIFAFLEKYRIEESKKLLESNRFSITEIAESLGFCNAFYFSKVFKKHEHISPSQYKKQH